MLARLTVHFPSRPARVFLLPEGQEMAVGREPECDVVLEDDRVSRRHALLVSAGGRWAITDLASKNGTQVDGHPVSEGNLLERSWISFGGLTARFEVVEGSVEVVQEERLRRLTASVEIYRGLDPSVGLGELLPRVVTSMLELTNAERGFLLLAGPQGELAVAARSGISWQDLQAEEFRGSLSAVQRALESGAPVVSSDACSDAALAKRASIIANGIRALLCMPVRALDRLIGVMYADSRKPGAAFTELDLDILAALAAQAGLAIAVARLDEELKGLAHRIAAAPETDPALRARLAAEVSAVLERSLQPARPASYLDETWAGIVAAHAPLGVGP